MKRRKGPFVRDVELHGHHKECPISEPEELMSACLCVELDHDDWIAAGEAAYDQQREEPRERTEYDD
jgi:hypothetical protein